MKTKPFFASLLVLALLVAAGIASAQGPQPETVQSTEARLDTAITYQGRLTEAGVPANGARDVRFSLYNRDVGGSQVGSTVVRENVPITNGLFTVQLDFGQVFDGTARWLEVAVRDGSSTGAYTTLSPRQPVTAAPYALHSADAWNLSGNAGTNARTNYIGTTDPVTFTVRVSDTAALRIVPATDGEFGLSPNLIGGHSANRVGTGVVGATIAGGGTSLSCGVDERGPCLNQVTADFGTIGGGTSNTAAEFATVGGGTSNIASDGFATVSGGAGNTASGVGAAVGGGDANIASGFYSAIPGGVYNRAQGYYSFAAGRSAHAVQDGTFVWADSTAADFVSTQPNQFLIRASGGVGIGTNSPAYKLDVAGPAHASSFPTSSDQRLKMNVVELSDVLPKLERVRGVSFDWNDKYVAMGRSTGHREIGVIAQEVEAVFPELVTRWGPEEYRAVDYGRLTGVLIEAVKELHHENAALKAAQDERIATLEARIAALERDGSRSTTASSSKPATVPQQGGAR
ncbi:MAG: tail fiber domain-containing protein [Anaerolineae bacterium]